jgi:hypothetical protein
MTKFEFDNKISLGNVITIAFAIFAIIGAYYDLRSRADNMMKETADNKHKIMQFEQEFVRKDIFNETKTKLDRIELKLDRLIERAN